MKRIASIAVLIAVAFVATLGGFKTARANVPNDEPVLLKATFFSHTNDENKDHDTGVYVQAKTSDGSSLIAHADNRDNSGDDGTEYKDGSDHQFDLDIDALGVKKSACQKFKVHVWIHTRGHDTWRFNGRVVLYFSDGTNLVVNRDGVELKNDGASTDF
jgi:hypothetical protein